MSGTLVSRRLDVIAKLGKGDFGQDGFDTVTLRGLRVSAHIQKLGYPDFNKAQIAIYGMKFDLMHS